jgi:hypothetical protein
LRNFILDKVWSGFRCCGDLWTQLWRNGDNLFTYSLRLNDSMDCVGDVRPSEVQALHRKAALTTLD